MLFSHTAGKRAKLRPSGLGLTIFSLDLIDVSLAVSYDRSEKVGVGKVQKDSETWKTDGQHCYLMAPVITQWGVEAGGWSAVPSCCYSECQRLL